MYHDAAFRQSRVRIPELLLLLALGAAMPPASAAVLKVPDSDEEPATKPGKAKKGRFDGDLKEVILPLARLQADKNKFGFIVYDDENPDPQKAKLVRGEGGIDANLNFLEIVGPRSFGKLQVAKILKGIAKENNLKFKNTTEKDEWIQCLQRRWLNMSRVISQAEARRPTPKWVRILPWHDGEEAEGDEFGGTEEVNGEVVRPEDALEDGEDAPDAETEADASEMEQISDDQALPAAEETQLEESQNPFGGDSSNADLEKAIAEAGTVPASDAAAAAHANSALSVFKFSTQLMLPMRSKLGDGGNAAQEPGRLHIDGLEPTDNALGQWPDGITGDLGVTVSFIQGLSRASSSSQKTPLWAGIHQLTKHDISIVQKQDRRLLLCINEQARQICMVRVDAFDKEGEMLDVDGEQKRKPDNDPIIQKALAFLTPIAQEFCEGRLEKGDLNKLKKERLTGIQKEGDGSSSRTKKRVSTRGKQAEAEEEPNQKKASLGTATTGAKVTEIARSAAGGKAADQATGHSAAGTATGSKVKVHSNGKSKSSTKTDAAASTICPPPMDSLEMMSQFMSQ